jgi:GT2 family glycosyltransferase
LNPPELARPATEQAAPLVKHPVVSVVMPFAGERSQATAAAAMLRSVKHGPDDELILVDNSGNARGLAGVRVVGAAGERSPAHARNAGAAAATGEWILFIDADCRPRHDLIEQYFAEPIGEDVGALAGEVVSLAQAADTGAPGQPPLAARYGAARSFLSQRQHLAHPYLPRAVAANLLVRRAAFEQVGGFYEGLRAAEDTDFTWRIQRAGWRIELRPQAWVEHRYRTTLSELRRQWRGYAAGRAWLARRYEGFEPETPWARALRRARRRARAGRTANGAGQPSAVRPGRAERGKYLAIDAFLALEELAGLMLSNRPLSAKRPAAPKDDAPDVPCAQGFAQDRSEAEGPAHNPTGPHAPVVFVADRFPSPGDPLVEIPSTLGARVEASGRPQVVPPDAHNLRIHYREDDGLAQRLMAFIRLCVCHPLRCVRDRRRRHRAGASLMALAPAVTRLQQEPDARVQPLGGGEAQELARRLRALAGRQAH